MYFLHMDGKYNPSDILTKFLNWAKFWPLVQPLLFWKGETAKDPQTTVPLTQLIAAIKTAALPSGSRGVTSGNNDVPLQEDTLVNPSGNASIIACTLSVSSHPRMSSIGQELGSGEPKQYIEPNKVNTVCTPTLHHKDMRCRTMTHHKQMVVSTMKGSLVLNKVPPGQDVLHGTIQPVVLSTSGTNSTIPTEALHESHTNNMKVQQVQLSTGKDVGSNWILHETVQPSTDIHLGSEWTVVRSRKSKI
jgi:hypothetical protein